MPRKSPPPLERAITFAETDAAGVAHFSRLAVIAEEAIHTRLKQLGIPVIDPNTAWPIVSLHIDYTAPLKFGDTVQLHLHPPKTGTTSITWNFEAFKPAGQKRIAVFHGTLTQCHLSPHSGKPTALPQAFRTLLKS
jgi:acyl-CoA thioesterase FadM